jgi:transcriptional regulator with XRE-family HTH domain
VTDIDRRRAAFGDRLRKLRARPAFLTGKDFATHLGWQQSRVSRIETGSQTATDADVIAWCNGTNTSGSAASELLDELREIRIEAASWRRQLRTGHAARQEDVRQVELAAKSIRAFESACFPALCRHPSTPAGCC